MPAITDQLHALLVARADGLPGEYSGTYELEAITDSLEAYAGSAVATWQRDGRKRLVTHV